MESKEDRRIMNQMNLLNNMLDFMRKEEIISHQRMKRLENDIESWWFIKTKQADKMRGSHKKGYKNHGSIK